MAGAKKCLEFGREAAKTECGVAYALDALSRKNVDVGAVRTGIETARIFAARAGQLLPGSKKEAGEVSKAASRVDDEVRLLKKVSKTKAAEIRKKMEDLRDKARKLFEKGAGACDK